MKKLISVLSVLLLLSACGQNNIMKDYKDLKTTNHHFVSEEPKTVMDKLENKEEGIYFVGYANCAFCQDLVPVLEEVLEETDKTAIYLDVSKDSFKAIIDRFVKFDNNLDKNLQSGGGVPFFIVIDKDQNIRTHVGTVDGYNPSVEEMSEDQTEYLKIKLKQAIEG